MVRNSHCAWSLRKMPWKYHIVLQELSRIAARVLGEAIALDTPLMEAGLDSISSVEVGNLVAAAFGVELPATVTFDYPTLQALAGFIHSRMQSSGQKSGTKLQVDQQSLQAEIDKLTTELKGVAEGIPSCYLHVLFSAHEPEKSNTMSLKIILLMPASRLAFLYCMSPTPTRRHSICIQIVWKQGHVMCSSFDSSHALFN